MGLENYNNIPKASENKKIDFKEDDFVVDIKNKLSKNVDLFVDSNNEYTSEQKNDIRLRLKKLLILPLKFTKIRNQDPMDHM